MKSAIAIAAASIAMGCTSVQRDMTPAQVSGFEEGRTTLAEVVGKLGPAPTSLAAGGQNRLIYYVGGASSMPGDDSPTLNDGVRGGIVILLFGADGKLLNKTVPKWFLAEEGNPGASKSRGASPPLAQAPSPALSTSNGQPSASASSPALAGSASRPVPTAAASRPSRGFHITFGPDPMEASH
jgi:hypothetical protein